MTNILENIKNNLHNLIVSRFNKITILLWVSSLKTNKAYVLDLLYN